MYVDCDKVIKFLFFSILSTVICKENKFGYCLKKKTNERNWQGVFHNADRVLAIPLSSKREVANANNKFYHHLL